MKSLIATALVALSLVAGTVAAQADTGYPDWAERAFDHKY